MHGDIKDIETYIRKVKKSVTETFSLIHSYNDILDWETDTSFKDDAEYEERKEEIDRALRREDEYVENIFSQNFLSGTILQFAYAGIKRFSRKSYTPPKYLDIKSIKNANQFIVGREIEDIHIGLIIYIGRNQWAHHWEKELKEPNITLFERLATWYSVTFNKYYRSPFYDLQNENVDIFASNLLHLMNWRGFEDFEKDMLEMAKEF